MNGTKRFRGAHYEQRSERWARSLMASSVAGSEPIAHHSTTFGVMVPGSNLTIAVVDGGWVLSGEIDAASASDLAAAISPRTPGRATLDIAEVSFMDSSGLRVLVEASLRARNDGGSLVLLNPQHAIRRLVILSGLAGHLELSDEPT